MEYIASFYFYASGSVIVVKRGSEKFWGTLKACTTLHATNNIANIATHRPWQTQIAMCIQCVIHVGLPGEGAIKMTKNVNRDFYNLSSVIVRETKP